MRAAKWRSALIGKVELISELRKTPIVPPRNIPDQIDMENDLKRTFPNVLWFTSAKHLGNIEKVLKMYAFMNPGVGYAQGMCFIAFLLYYVYYTDNPNHAVNDTFFSFHTIMGFIRPFYPRDMRDIHIGSWLESTASVIRLKILYHYPKLAARLRNTAFIKLMMIKTGPALFANWFKMHDTEILWDYLFHGDIFENMLNAIAAMLIHHKEVYIHLSEEKALQITAIKDFYRVSSVVSYAYTLKR